MLLLPREERYDAFIEKKQRNRRKRKNRQSERKPDRENQRAKQSINQIIPQNICMLSELCDLTICFKSAHTQMVAQYKFYCGVPE